MFKALRKGFQPIQRSALRSYHISKLQNATFRNKAFKRLKNVQRNPLRKYASQTRSGNNNALYFGAAGVTAMGVGYYLMNSTLNSSSQKETSLSTFKTIPSDVQSYIKGCYSYLIASLGVTGAAAYASLRSGATARLFNARYASIGLFIASMACLIGAQAVSPENAFLKHSLFLGFSSIMGLSLSPVLLLGSGVLLKAGLYTSGIVGGMSLTAFNAKEEQFLYLGGPLMAILAVMVVASLGRFLLPLRFARTHSAIEGFSLYGGLALFSAFLLYDTQKMVARGRQYSEVNKVARIQGRRPVKPDYMRDALSIYLDIINIFIRLATIFSGRKK